MVDYIARGVKGTIVLFFFTFLGAVFGYLTRLVLAHTISPEQFGLFYSVMTLFMFIGVFTELGYSSAVIKFLPGFIVKKRPDLVKKTVGIMFAATLALTLIAVVALVAMSGFLAKHYFKTQDAVMVIWLFAIVLVLNCIVGVYQSVLQGFQKMTVFGLFYFLSKALFLVACAGLFFIGFRDALLPSWAFLLSLLALLLFFTPYFFRLFWQKDKRKPDTSHDFGLFKDVTRFAIPNLFTLIAATVIGYIDTILLTYLVPLEIVGVYNAVLPTVLMLSLVGSSLSSVLFPMVSELWAKNKKKCLGETISLIYRYTLIAIVPLAICALFFSETVLLYLFGKEFLIGAVTMKILALGIIFLTIAQINFSVLNGIGKPVLITKITIAAAALNVIGNILLIPYFGMNGSAFTTSISYVLMFAWSYALTKKEIPFKTQKFLEIIMSCLLFFISLFLLRMVFPGTGLLNSIIVFVVALLFYMILLFVFRLIDFKELKGMMARKY